VNQEGAIDIHQLKAELEMVSNRLRHARRTLNQHEDGFIQETCARMDYCAVQIAQMKPNDRALMQSSLLAALDEVDQTMKAFNDELVRSRRELASSNQGRAAGAAYRRAQNSDR